MSGAFVVVHFRTAVLPTRDQWSRRSRGAAARGPRHPAADVRGVPAPTSTGNSALSRFPQTRSEASHSTTSASAYRLVIDPTASSRRWPAPDSALVEETDGVFAVIARHRNELIQDLMLLVNRGGSIPFSQRLNQLAARRRADLGHGASLPRAVVARAVRQRYLPGSKQEESTRAWRQLLLPVVPRFHPIPGDYSRRRAGPPPKWGARADDAAITARVCA